MTDTITLSRAEFEAVKDALTHARNIAMEQTMKARIPECGEFGAIAQNLDWALNVALVQQAEQVPEVLPPFGTKRKAAMAIYQAPFKYIGGYIYDANHRMVSDDDKVEGAVISRVRGWGRIGYMPNPEQLQDEIGAMIADALTIYYKENK